MKIQVLIDKNSWAEKYKKKIKEELCKFDNNIIIINHHKKLKYNYDLNIVFSYFKLIPKSFLSKSKFNIIPHESKLPKGKGMSPLSWQILEGKSNIYFSLIEASERVDDGHIYFQEPHRIPKNMIFEEIKKRQFQINLRLIKKFILKIRRKKKIKAIKQKGSSSYYKKRYPKDSKIDINKSILSQIDLIRICDNENYPAYFHYKNNKFIIRINKVK